MYRIIQLIFILLFAIPVLAGGPKKKVTKDIPKTIHIKGTVSSQRFAGALVMADVAIWYRGKVVSRAYTDNLGGYDIIVKIPVGKVTEIVEVRADYKGYSTRRIVGEVKQFLNPPADTRYNFSMYEGGSNSANVISGKDFTNDSVLYTIPNRRKDDLHSPH